jgi:ribosomal protein S18 acetylase RimI-like enzyme
MIIREAKENDSAAIARVHIDSWRTTYRDMVSTDHLASLSYEEREQRWQEFFSATDSVQFAYVAEYDDELIVGFASGGPNRDIGSIYEGELYAIYLLEEHQHQGIGRELTRAVVKRLLQEGMSSMQVWVLAENPGGGFYESIGGRRLKEQEMVIGGTTLIEVAYGWSDLSRFVT